MGWPEPCQHSRPYLLCDLWEGGSLDGETRKFVADWVSHHQLSGIANYGIELHR